ncbi:MAG: hypothetical protein P1P82_02255 [Bacteroidales bacterium]|nr:hypothetical protein [Bacteroidales bacterium]MDT8433026.1 hypothetical protein [Bacteroidales bacterium]
MKATRKKRTRRTIAFIFMAIVVLTLFAVGTIYNPDEIIASIGRRNGYIIAFVIAFFAGFSAFTAVSFYSLLIASLAAGLNPVLLAVITGTSLALGDMFLFYFGHKGRDLIRGKVDRRINQLANYFRKHNLEKRIPLISYVYISFLPLPNDWLLIFLATLKYPQTRLNLVIIIGDLTHVSILVFLASRGIQLFS